MKRSDIRKILETGLLPVMMRLHKRLLEELVVSAFKHLYIKSSENKQGQEQLRLAVVQYLVKWVQDRLNGVAALQDAYDEFVQQHSHAVTTAERDRHVLEFAQELGSASAQLRGDRRALKRWFGFEAVSERFHRRISGAQRDVAFVLERIGIIFGAELKALPDVKQAKNHWRRIELEDLIKPMLDHGNSTVIRIAAFRSLATALRALPAELHEQSVADVTLRYIHRAALDRRQDIALQCEALKLLAEISPASLQSALNDRLGSTPEGDDLFVRRVALRLLGERLLDNPDLAGLLECVAEDPSPAVRQLLVSAGRPLLTRKFNERFT